MEIKGLREGQGAGSTAAATPGDTGKSHCNAGSTVSITSSLSIPSLAGYRPCSLFPSHFHQALYFVGDTSHLRFSDS